MSITYILTFILQRDALVPHPVHVSRPTRALWFRPHLMTLLLSTSPICLSALSASCSIISTTDFKTSYRVTPLCRFSSPSHQSISCSQDQVSRGGAFMSTSGAAVDGKLKSRIGRAPSNSWTETKSGHCVANQRYPRKRFT